MLVRIVSKLFYSGFRAWQSVSFLIWKWDSGKVIKVLLYDHIVDVQPLIISHHRGMKLFLIFSPHHDTYYMHVYKPSKTDVDL